MDENARVGKNPDRGNFADEVVIILPDRRVLSVLARSLFLAAALLTLPWLHGVREIFASGDALERPPEDIIETAFHDLLNEHLVTVGEYAIFIGGSPEIPKIRALIDDGILPPLDVVDQSNDNGRSIANGAVDFAFAANGFRALPLIDRVLRVGGVAALRFGSAADTRRIRPNYKIVYLRRFEAPDLHTVVAVQKINAGSRGNAESTTEREKPNFCPSSDAKPKAVQDLEDVHLEPRSATFLESGAHVKRIRYLPAPTEDDLRSHSGHVYVDIGRTHRSSGTDERYRQSKPMNGRNFDVYSLDDEVAGADSPTVTWSRKDGFDVGFEGLSRWLKRHVSRDEFVVMKMDVGGSPALLEVVREMVRSRAVCLVDELFLVCEPQEKARNRVERKAYWECLALYGMLRNGGVAVHQWWK